MYLFVHTWKLNTYAFHWCVVCYDRTIFGRDTTIWKSEGAKNQNTEKIAFKVVQMKFLAILQIKNKVLI